MKQRSFLTFSSARPKNLLEACAHASTSFHSQSSSSSLPHLTFGRRLCDQPFEPGHRANISNLVEQTTVLGSTQRFCFQQTRGVLQIKYRKEKIPAHLHNDIGIGNRAATPTSGKTNTSSTANPGTTTTSASHTFTNYEENRNKKAQSATSNSSPSSHNIRSDSQQQHDSEGRHQSCTSSSSSRLPYLVRRTPSGNLPVYAEQMPLFTGASYATQGYRLKISKIWGDANSLLQELKKSVFSSEELKAIKPKILKKRGKQLELSNLAKNSDLDDKIKKYLVAAGF
ncbi:unnamed protein product [Amoebophrya sp. A120]|nr:unnamed protein product [Amoebophrya sp. A120]|eukprot:GSA120T00009316001.1